MTVEKGLRTAEFAFPGALRERLVQAILDGDKTATSGLLVEYGPDEALPAVGERFLVVDSDGRAVAVIETTELRVVPIGEIDDAFARDEGEGFASVGEWREAHVRFWESDEVRAELGRPEFRVTDDALVVAERFRLVERLEPPRQAGCGL